MLFVVQAGICNPLRVLRMTLLIFVKDTVRIFNIHQLMLADRTAILTVHTSRPSYPYTHRNLINQPRLAVKVALAMAAETELSLSFLSHHTDV